MVFWRCAPRTSGQVMDQIYGVEWLRWAAERSSDPAWTDTWLAIAALGSPAFFAVVLPLVFALAPVRPALRLALAFALAATTSEWIKHLVGRARPDPLDFGLTAPLESAGAYASAAFPSGHAVLAVVLWGMIAVHARSLGVRIACAVLVLVIGASRIVLLRHDLLDVGGGFAIGGVLLVLLVRAEGAWGASLAELPRIERAGSWILGAIVLQVLADLQVTAIVLGVAAGFGAGATLAAGRRVRESAPGVGWGAVRAVLAVGGVAFARALAEPGDGWATSALFTLYMGAGIWVGGLVPLFTGGVWERPASAGPR